MIGRDATRLGQCEMMCHIEQYVLNMQIESYCRMCGNDDDVATVSANLSKNMDHIREQLLLINRGFFSHANYYDSRHCRAGVPCVLV